MSKIKKEFPYKLFVEGPNDCHVISSLCGCHKVHENFNIVSCGSVEKVIGNFKLALTNPTVYQRIGIVVDADVDVEKRWRQLEGILKDSGKYDCSDLNLSSDGLVLSPIDSYDAIIGVWIMPNNSLQGMLEDFVFSLVPAENPLIRKAETVLSELEEEGTQQYKAVHRSKAKVHTFLAWQDEPGRPMGQAITAHIMDANAGQAKAFVDWLDKLFCG